jgi:Mg2+ and Co2+ transporter CorA
MEDLNTVKSWESKLRKEIEGLKACKDRIITDSAIPKVVKDRFVDVLRTLKMNMIQVMAKCTQLRNETLQPKAFKVRVEKLKFEYEEVTKSLLQLVSTLQSDPENTNPGYKYQENDEEIHSAVSKELADIRNIMAKTQKALEAHRHQEYEQRIEILESENQELRKNLSKIQDDNLQTYEILHSLRKRLEKLENFQNESKESLKPSDLPKKRVLLRPSSHAEDFLKAYQ